MLALILVACAPAGPELRPDQQTGDPERLAERGQHAEAAQAWLDLAEEQPARGVEARIAAARQWLEAGRLEEARALVSALRVEQFAPELDFEVTLLGAEIALAERDFTTAGRILSLPRERVPATMRDRFDALNERLAEANPNSPAARVEALADALSEPGFRPEMALALLLELPLETLRNLQSEHQGRPTLTPWLDLAVSARARLIDDPELQRALAGWRQRYDIEADVADDLYLWIAAWRQTLPMPESVAVLLPGDGPLARAGAVLREGLLGAWLQMPRDRRPQLEFHYLDNDPDAAVGAWFEAREQDSDFVIGPLASSQVDSLLALPDVSVPTLLLNRPTDDSLVPDRTRPIAMLALPPEEEAELAAVRALVNEFDRAVIVAQQSDFGKRVADRFSETFQLGGGQVIARTEYVPGEFDHTETLETLLEIDRSRERIARLERVLGSDIDSEPQRRTDFDLVFLAARGGDGRQIMPQLRFLGVQPRPVYATSDIWPGGDVGSDLDGIQFPAAPWVLQQGEAARQRLRAEQMYPELVASPTRSVLHALGRDALAMVPWMSMMKDDPLLYLAGNVGRLRLANGVVLERDMPWARIEEGRPVRYEPEPTD
jgi:outer membrane PBP1 activator LpoA protein